jgi:peroxiredoxin
MRGILLALLLAPSALASDAWLGLLLSDSDAHFGGTRVREVLAGSPGEKAGITPGDEVLSVDDHKTENASSLIGEVKQAGVGKQVKVRVVDPKGHTRTVEVKLEARPDMRTMQRTQLVGKPAPDFEPAVQAGPKLGKLSSLRGKVVLIDFFATWCGPCVMAMPHLEELHQKLGPKGLTVLGISTESSAIVAGAAQRFRLSYTLASDENEGISGSYRVFALPTMILIDKKGVVREVSVNDPEAIDAALEKALK